MLSRCVQLSPFSSVSQIRQKLKDHKAGKKIGFTYVSSLKALGLIPRANGQKKVSPKYLKCMGKRVPKKIGGPRPEQHSNLYTNENPSDTIPIRFRTIQDVKNTIKRLERLRKSKKYTRARISQVAHVLEQRTRFMKGKEKHNELAKEYTKHLAHLPST